MVPDARLASLCRRIRTSDRDAFAEAFRELRPPLLRFVDARVRDPIATHDLVQDVFLSLWEQRHTLDPNQSLKALLFRMARNRSLNYLRGQRVRTRHLSSLTSEAAVNGATNFEARDLAARLKNWITDLPERQRKAIELTRFAELSHREAAEVMDISPRTLNNHLVRALASLNRRRAALEADID